MPYSKTMMRFDELYDKKLRGAFDELVLKKLEQLSRSKSWGLMLDVGCHIGKNMTLFTEQDWLSVGVDVNRALLEKAKMRGNGVLASATNLPFRNRTFDVIVLSLILHHVADALTVLKETSRVLNGKMLLVENLEDNPFLRYSRKLIRFWRGGEIMLKFDFQQLIRTIKKSKFRIIQVEKADVFYFLVPTICLYLPKLLLLPIKPLTSILSKIDKHVQKLIPEKSAFCLLTLSRARR